MRTWHTYKKMLSDWETISRKWEKQDAYERGIVKSVPPMYIEVPSVDINADDWCDPG